MLFDNQKTYKHVSSLQHSQNFTFRKKIVFFHFITNSHLCAKVEAVEPEVDCVLGKMMVRMWKRKRTMNIGMRMRKMLKTRMVFTASLGNSIPGQDYLGHHVLAVGHGRV